MLTPTPPEALLRYDLAAEGAGLPARVAIFGEDAEVRAQCAADLGGAGLRTIDGGTLGALIDGPIALLGDVVIVDCPAGGPHGLDAMALAALARLDERVARAGAKLIVSTSLACLDDVFAVLDQSAPQILVAPSRAERVIAVGRAMGEAGAARVREMGEEERLALLRLSQQVEAIARSLDRLWPSLSQPDAPLQSPPEPDGGGTASAAVGDLRREYRGPEAGIASGFAGSKASQPKLPDPRVVRQVIANRQARTRFFDAALFADPAWDMLLDLTAAHGEGAKVSVTSLCIASGVPATTALRWISQMVESGLFVRLADPDDRRRAFIALSDKALAAMSAYFASLRTPAALAA